MSSSEASPGWGYSVLYKGPSGTGKTYNTLTWPTPLVVACTDRNMRTLRTATNSGMDVTPVFIHDWKDFEDDFAPAVVNRKYECATVAIDTLDMLGVLLQREVQGARARMTQADWGTMLNKWIDCIGGIMETTVDLGQGCYNVVCTVHTKDVTDDSGGLIKIAPSIGGAFKDMVEGFFDWVLLTECEVKATTVQGKSEYTKQFQVRTVPPNRYHTCKGGGLPAVCSGTYQGLMENESKEF